MTGDEITHVYALGFTQGEEVGYGRAHQEMDAEWARVAERVKATGRTLTADELEQRRHTPGGPIWEAAMRSRGGREYQGGAVDFLTGQPIITEETA